MWKFRDKLSDFFRIYGKFILIFLLVVILSWILAFVLRLNNLDVKPKEEKNLYAPTLQTPKAKPSKQEYDKSYEKVQEFCELASKGEYVQAQKLVSPECMYYAFQNVNEYIGYLEVFFKGKKYDIEPYYSEKNLIVYQVKLFDDFLQSGLSGQDFQFYDAKITVIKDGDNYKLGLRSFIKEEPADGFVENNEVSIKVTKRVVFFSFEEIIFEVKNRTQDYLVAAEDPSVLKNQPVPITAKYGPERRKDDSERSLIIGPYQTLTSSARFVRFFESEPTTGFLSFNNLKFYKKYVVPVTEQEAAENQKNLVNQFKLLVPIIS